MIFKWEPKGTLDSEGNDFGNIFEGYIELDIKPKMERLRMAKEAEMVVNSEGEAEIKRDILAQVESAGKIVASCCKKVELKAGDHKITSIEELEMFEEGVQLVTSLLSMCIGGIRLGKSSKGK